MKRILALLLLLSPFAATVHADEVAVLRIKSGGKIQRVILEFYEDAAPNTVANFKKLASKHFFNGTALHRVFPNTMIQGGDPLSKHKGATGVGTGGPGYTLAPEIRRSHTVGTVAAARLPDKINPARRSNGSQFYIALKAMPNLDGYDTVFAHVIEGLPALEAVSQVRTDTNDNPVERVVIESVRIVPREAASSVEPGENRLQRIFRRLF